MVKLLKLYCFKICTRKILGSSKQSFKHVVRILSHVLCAEWKASSYALNSTRGTTKVHFHVSNLFLPNLSPHFAVFYFGTIPWHRISEWSHFQKIEIALFCTEYEMLVLFQNTYRSDVDFCKSNNNQSWELFVWFLIISYAIFYYLLNKYIALILKSS